MSNTRIILSIKNPPMKSTLRREWIHSLEIRMYYPSFPAVTQRLEFFDDTCFKHKIFWTSDIPEKKIIVSKENTFHLFQKPNIRGNFINKVMYKPLIGIVLIHRAVDRSHTFICVTFT
jgi:hypothetical protein